MFKWIKSLTLTTSTVTALALSLGGCAELGQPGKDKGTEAPPNKTAEAPPDNAGEAPPAKPGPAGDKNMDGSQGPRNQNQQNSGTGQP